MNTPHGRYYAATATQAAFPLGGIGTGNISLGARGDLRDWEIFNAPAKGTYLPNTFVTISVAPHGAPRVTRVLEGPVTGTHALSHGYHPHTGVGLPRFAHSTLAGTYPIAELAWQDDAVPVQVALEAFTPFVPLHPSDSGIPGAVFNYRLQNPGSVACDVALVFSLYDAASGVEFDKYGNIIGQGGSLIVAERNEQITTLVYRNVQRPANDERHAELTLSTNCPDVSVRTAWERGGWWDYVQDFWDDVHSDGRLTDYAYGTPTPKGANDTGSLAAHVQLAPGETRVVTFVLTWYVPNRRKTWEKATAPLTQNHYATRYTSAMQVATDLWQRLDVLSQQTRQFRDVMARMSLPEPLRDALAATIVPMRSTTCFWLADGNFYGWEGCFDDAGCCPGTCTHVWSYAYAMAYLFPQLERNMRLTEFTVETETDGYMIFRTFQNFGEEFVWGWGDQRPEACIDGQMGCVLRAWREWQLSGDRAWLQAIYPGVARAVDYAHQHWDQDGDGIPDGRQHNTYDIEFYGANPLSTLYFLAGLKAGAALARAMGDGANAERWDAMAAQGQQRFVELCWNGAYFIQHIDDVDAYRYQHGVGILTDQLLGQLHATLLGLGDLVPAAMVERTLQEIYTHNFRTNFHGHANTQRSYVLEQEQGLVMCSWPHGGRPRFPFVYSEEVWTGVEYHVAAHLLASGDMAAATRIVAALRDRHNGMARNPWNEVECGHHYARTMSAWMLLPAASGFVCDMDAGWMRFAPNAQLLTADQVVLPWFTQHAWGVYHQFKAADGSWQARVEVLAGACAQVRIEVPAGVTLVA